MLDTLRKLKENKKLDCELVVAHVNHMIREEAIDDQKFVENFCKKMLFMPFLPLNIQFSAQIYLILRVLLTLSTKCGNINHITVHRKGD